MRAAPELWGCSFLLLTDDKERNWRVIGAVEVVGFQYQIFPGVQRLQEVQQCMARDGKKLIVTKYHRIFREIHDRIVKCLNVALKNADGDARQT